MATPNINALIDIALQIAQERRGILSQMRAALEAGDDAQALQLARKLCGLGDETHDKKGDRTDSRIN